MSKRHRRASARQSRQPNYGDAKSPTRNVGAYGDTAHNAASYGTELRNWRTASHSADTDARYESETIRARARDLDRNEALARGYLDSTTNGVNGVGLRLTPTPIYRALGRDKVWSDQWSRTVRDLMRSAMNSTDVDAQRYDSAGGIGARAFRNMLASGGCGIWFTWKKDPTRRWSTCVRLIEKDRISNPNYTMDTPNLRDGIVLDDDGAHVGYWICSQHPGEQTDATKKREWTYIPRYTAWGRVQFAYIYDKERVDQNYGLSFLTAVIPEFKILGDYKKAELQAALANAIVAMIFESSATFEQIAGIFGNTNELMKARESWTEAARKGLAPGAVISPFPGDKLQTFAPGRPNEKAVEFLHWASRHIATGLGVPLETITHDWTGLNYSAARTVILDAYRTYVIMRAFLEHHYYQPLYENLFEEAVYKNAIPDVTPDTYYPYKREWTCARWSGPAKGWVDPEKEINASIKRVQSGQSSLEIECDEQGNDWLDIAEQRATERAYYVNVLGMPYPGDPPAPPPAGNTNTQDQVDPQDAEQQQQEAA